MNPTPETPLTEREQKELRMLRRMRQCIGERFMSANANARLASLEARATIKPSTEKTP